MWRIKRHACSELPPPQTEQRHERLAKVERQSTKTLSFRCWLERCRFMRGAGVAIGFTLAEVLITLGIIGVVAAVTIPTLIHNHKKKLIETRLTQTVSIINQLLKRIEADEGEIDNWSYWSTTGNAYNRQRDFAQNTVMKYIPTAKLCNNNGSRECFYNRTVNGKEKNAFAAYYKDTNKIILPNGSGFWLNLDNTSNMGAIRKGSVLIDLNISKNKMYNGVDFFLFTLMKGPQNNILMSSVSTAGNNYSGWNPYLPKCGSNQRDKDGNVLNAVQLCQNPDLDNYYGYPQAYCTVLIECNGWKIPDNYPIKF